MMQIRKFRKQFSYNVIDQATFVKNTFAINKSSLISENPPDRANFYRFQQSPSHP